MRGLAGSAAAVRLLQAHGGKQAGVGLLREQTLTAMTDYMARVGLGELPPMIHIAGTKGKGSTAVMCEAILRAAGLKTGLFTSPHLVDLRERVRVDGELADADLFCRHFWFVWDALELAASGEGGGSGEGPARALASIDPEQLERPPPSPAVLSRMPGFFQFLTLVAMRLFAEMRVDAVVLEVGLGGRLDATNAVAGWRGGSGGASELPLPPVLVCGVSLLDYDHVELLGGSLPAIAEEKAGIFKTGVPAVTIPQEPAAAERLRAVAARVGAPLLETSAAAVAARWTPASGAAGDASAGMDFPPLGLGGTHQRDNAALAVALTDVFLARRRLQQRVEVAGGQQLGAYVDQVLAEAAAAAAATTTGASSSTAGSSTRIVTAYDPGAALPLPAHTLAGLAGVRWAGRAQVVELGLARQYASTLPGAATGATGGGSGNKWRFVSRSAPPPHGEPTPPSARLVAPAARLVAPAATLFLDGAHTGRSMRACVAWFLRASAAAAPPPAAAVLSPPQPPPPRRVLVFYCGRDKDVLELLLPLSLVRWDAVYFVAPALEKPGPATADAAAAGAADATGPSHSPPHSPPAPLLLLSPAARAVVAEHLRRSAGKGGSGGGAAEGGTTSALDAACRELLLAARAGGEETPQPQPHDEAWPATLRGLWTALQPAQTAAPEHLAAARSEEAASLLLQGQGQGALALEAEAAVGAAARTVVCSSVRAALDALADAEVAGWGCGASGGPPPTHCSPLHVLVTGSLYTVGDALGCVAAFEEGG